MRLAYAGTAPFAANVLAGLVATGIVPDLVITTPDKPRGHHGTPQPSAVKARAGKLGLEAIQPARPDEDDGLVALRQLQPDVIIVVAYGRILSSALLDEFLTICAHPSLVPRWRGAAPVERAIMAGDTETGVTTFRVTLGIDEGPVSDVRRLTIASHADAGAVYEALVPLAVAGLKSTLDRIADGSVDWVDQVDEAVYADKIAAADRLIDWRRPAPAIVDQVRGLAPHIGAETPLAGRRTFVWSARALDDLEAAPTNAGERLVLPAGSGFVEILELQQESRRRMTAGEFLRGAGRGLVRP